MMASQGRRFTDDVRIGPISVLALIAILSMAVLAVLAVSTAHASLVISQRQADAVADSYMIEMAAQDFMAEMDAQVAGGRMSQAAASRAIEGNLPAIAQHAQEEAHGQVSVSASVESNQVRASFSYAGARTLSIEVSVTQDGSLRVDKWSMAAMQNTAEPAGSLWMGA